MNKKIISMAIACTMLLIPTTAFAADNTAAAVSGNDEIVDSILNTGDITDPSASIGNDNPTTSADTSTVNKNATAEQNQARETFFSTVYMDKMAVIVDLRAQTKTAVSDNKEIAAKIKDALKAKFITPNSDIIDEAKADKQSIKDEVSNMEILLNQKKQLQNEYKQAVKNNDTTSMKNIEAQIQALLPQIDALRAQIEKDRTAAGLVKDQVKDAREAEKTAKASLQSYYDKVKALHDTIVSEENAKNQMWVTFRANVKAYDFTSAAAALDNIIAAKTQIISDIEARGTALNDLLTAVSNLK